MMPSKDKYYSDDENMLQLVTDLNNLINQYYLNKKTLTVLCGFNDNCIDDFLNLKDGLTYKQSVKLYNVIFNITQTFKNIMLYKNEEI